jgi:hypothetical protein
MKTFWVYFKSGYGMPICANTEDEALARISLEGLAGNEQVVHVEDLDTCRMDRFRPLPAWDE